MSLQDLFMQRAALENPGAFGKADVSQLNNLWTSVAQSLEKRRQERVAEQKEKVSLQEQIKMIDEFNNSQAGKLGTLIPSVSMKDGKISVDAKSVSPQDTLQQQRQERYQKQFEFQQSNTMRNQFQKLPAVADYITISTNVNAMESLLNNAIASNKKENMVGVDQALITMFNKLTDPSSVVRESEYARTPSNLPMVNAIQGAFQKVQSGGAGLTNEDRKALVLAAKIIEKERGNQYNQHLQDYTNLSAQQGIDPSLVVMGYKPYETDMQKALDVNLEMVTPDGVVGSTEKQTTGLPQIGSMFNGQKVKSVKKVR